MADNRDQGPHYIPELDPENSKRPKSFSQPVLWASLIGGSASLIAAGAAWHVGDTQLAIVLGAVSAALFTPFWFMMLVGDLSG